MQKALPYRDHLMTRGWYQSVPKEAPQNANVQHIACQVLYKSAVMCHMLCTKCTWQPYILSTYGFGCMMKNRCFFSKRDSTGIMEWHILYKNSLEHEISFDVISALRKLPQFLWHIHTGWTLFTFMCTYSTVCRISALNQANTAGHLMDMRFPTEAVLHIHQMSCTSRWVNEKRRNSIAKALELRLSCNNPSIWGDLWYCLPTVMLAPALDATVLFNTCW